MLCKSCLRNVIVQAGHLGVFTQKGVKLSNTGKSFHAGLGLTSWWNRKFRTSLRMMVDTGASAKQGPFIDLLPEKDEEGGFSSGGWKRLQWLLHFIIYIYILFVSYGSRDNIFYIYVVQ